MANKERTPGTPPVTADPWAELQGITAARIALGRAGSSLPLQASLAFRLDHARARDAVHAPFAPGDLIAKLANSGLTGVELESEVADRQEYLTRPDKGRRLSRRSAAALATALGPIDICLVVGDGLSPRAVEEQAPAVIRDCSTLFHLAGFTLAPVCVVRNARVAIGDEIARHLQARLVVVLIGERPGLSAANSLGLYLTLDPYPGITDARRNCISNIRPGGLSIAEAVRRLAYLVEEAFRLGTSGVDLKDRMAADYLPFSRAISLSSPPDEE
ncbi:MAG: ethanolamine ammonia-lyase subunit EutC [Desulforhopalus sp.]|jgi:ethanolamine ammonia-lyase small subunit|nr:ethanolamine ammonia-lyase subunit EutC [Desulforhopalus sp.]